jgi:hypothetical protein
MGQRYLFSAPEIEKKQVRFANEESCFLEND